MTEPLLDRRPPANLLAEQGVLGEMLESRESLRNGVEELSEGDFYTPQHQMLFRTLAKMVANDQPALLANVVGALEAEGRLESCGGMAYLLGLQTHAPGELGLPYLVAQIKDLSLLRRIWQTSAEIFHMAQERGAGGAELLEEISSRWNEIDTGVHAETMGRMGEMLGDVLDDLERRQNPNLLQMLPTGWDRYDNLIGGLEPGRLYVWAGRPKTGKSTAVVNLLTHLAVREQVPVALFSMEMKARAVLQKVLSAESGVSSYDLRMARISSDQWDRLIQTAGTVLYDVPFWIDDARGMGADQIALKARRIARRERVRVIAIDYLQIVRHGNRDARVGFMQAVHTLQALAGELNVSLLLLSQVSRAVNQRPGKFPTLEDLKETGALEEDADLVTFLYHPPGGDPNPKGGVMQFVVAANRYGPAGNCPVYWDPTHQRIRDVTDEEMEQSRSDEAQEQQANRRPSWWLNE